MKLLVVIPNYWPAFTRGGPVFSVHYLNRTLNRKGIDVTIYTTSVDADDKVITDREVLIEGIKVVYCSFSHLFDFIARYGWQFSFPMAQFLKRNIPDFDLIYIVTTWRYPTIAAAYYSQVYKKPYVFSPRGMLYPTVFYKKAWKKWLYYQFFIKKILERASAIHYTTEDEAEKTQSFLRLRNQVIIVPNGIEIPQIYTLSDKSRLRRRYPYLKDKKVVLFLGRLIWKKGLDILVEAYARSLKDRSDLHLFIAGPDETGYSRKVKVWLRDCGISYLDYASGKNYYMTEPKVTFTGMLTGEEKVEAYTGSDIFVLPSYSENFGLSVVEAMAYGLPVVISNKVGIYKEIRRNKAGIVTDIDAESFYRGMKVLLADSGLREQISINARKLVEERYDIDKVADKFIEEMESIIR
jgi:glycosyltransferase involved in cell wall biosynthesis